MFEWLHRLTVSKPETLTAMLVPKGHIGRGLNPRDADEFFSPYFKKIEDGAREAYRCGFSVERSTLSDSRALDLGLRGEKIKISYTPSPLLDVQGQNIYTGILNVVQTPLSLMQASNFLQKLMDDFYLAYHDNGRPHFPVFHSKGDKTVHQDGELLLLMGIHPVEAVKYYLLPGVACWGKVDISLSDLTH